MFKIYDLNMKEITLPEGVMPLEIFVGSVAKNRITEAADGRAGVVDYGFNYTDRPVSLFLRIKAADAADFRLLRNEVFATFDFGSAFYVAEADVPSRVLKVVVDESYIPERLTEEYADFDINCRTLDSVFWESRYTTLELHNSGYSATAEKYGLVDSIDDEKIEYKFAPESDYQPNLIPLTQSAWEAGNWYTTNGTAGGMAGNLRTKIGQISVTEGEWYTFDDSSVYASAIDTVYLLHYKNGVYLGSSGGWLSLKRGGGTSFVAKGDEIRISLRPMDGHNVPLSHINHTDKRIQMKLEFGEEHTGYITTRSSFNVYNAGNVTVEPESMELEILIKDVVITDKMTIRNYRTGEIHTYNFSTVNPSEYKIKGMMVLRSSVNVFRNTNKRFISLKPGDNNIEITGASFSEVIFNFKYYYK